MAPMLLESEVTIRLSRRQDVDAVTEIEHMVAPYPWTAEQFVEELENQSRSLVVADYHSTVVGFGGVMLAGGEATIMNMAVHPHHQRQGVGRRLLARLLSVAGEMGATSATLEVRCDNKPAIGFYRQFGFEATGTRHDYYQDGTDARIMWLTNLPDRKVATGNTDTGNNDTAEGDAGGGNAMSNDDRDENTEAKS